MARLRELLGGCGPGTTFPAADLYKSPEIEPTLNDAEIDRILGYGYQGRYTNLVLSLLYPDRDWKDAVFHEDHIFPQSAFQVRGLKKRGYDETKIKNYLSRYNTICNLELLTESENLSKNATPFDEWLQTRDAAFRQRHLIPVLSQYDFDHFIKFSEARTNLIIASLKHLNDEWQDIEGATLTGPPAGEGDSKTAGESDSRYSGRDFKDIEAEFQELHAELTELERVHNPSEENLHFECLSRADAELYTELLELANGGLQKVRQHRRFFLEHDLYSDGMFWYDLFLMISAAAVRIHRDKLQATIPTVTVEALTERLVQISEFTLPPNLGGDITKRNYEALGNTLWAFPGDKLIDTAKEAARQIGTEPVQEFVDGTISHIRTL